MEIWSEWSPLAVSLPVVLALLFGVRWLQERFASKHHFRNQGVLLALTLIGAVAIILALPLEPGPKANLLTLFGILLSAAIALSSTTLLGNVLAGLMLRAMRNFRIGDFLRCGEFFGRVTERGLLHVEIQTEDRDLTTLPNLFLVTHPMRVLRQSGTIVSASVSLGYGVARAEAKAGLLRAAELTGLRDPFVQISELGDFSILYRVGGLLGEVTETLTTRSRLRGAMLDSLHEAGIEIVSPTFMNTRALPRGEAVVPRPGLQRSLEQEESTLESLAFDKADLATSVEALREERENLTSERVEMTKRRNGTRDDAVKRALADELERIDRRLALLEQVIEARAGRLESDDR